LGTITCEFPRANPHEYPGIYLGSHEWLVDEGRYTGPCHLIWVCVGGRPGYGVTTSRPTPAELRRWGWKRAYLACCGYGHTGPDHPADHVEATLRPGTPLFYGFVF